MKNDFLYTITRNLWRTHLVNKCELIKRPNINSIRFSDFRLSNLRETGRLQFFFHSPKSEYPVRDITNEQRKGYKTEPHIEKCAENYCSECYQSNNIVPFLKSDEKYLFLFTTCKNRSLKKFYNQRLIVGYIIKERALRRQNGKSIHWAVQGETKLYSFSNAFPLTKLVDRSIIKHIRVRTLTSKETSIILQHFDGKRNILVECINELKRLKDTIK